MNEENQHYKHINPSHVKMVWIEQPKEDKAFNSSHGLRVAIMFRESLETIDAQILYIDFEDERFAKMYVDSFNFKPADPNLFNPLKH